VSNFVLSALRGEDLTLYGDGSQTRSFCFVDDLVEGLMRLMDSEDSVVGPINLGNPTEMTVKELAETVTELVGGKNGISYHPLPQDDPMQRQPNIDKARRLLGWEPKVPLRTGLEKTIAYFRDFV
jgi:UDP-glucuronate decarboxylase